MSNNRNKYKARIQMVLNVEDTITGAWHQVVMTSIEQPSAPTKRVFNIDGYDHAEWVKDGLVPVDGKMQYATHPQRAAFVKALHDTFDNWPHGEVEG